MKNIIFVVFILIMLLPTIEILSQPATGYDKVNWGISPFDCQKVYPNINKGEGAIILELQNPLASFSTIGVVGYTENNAGNNIEERTFYFYENKLFMVRVFYDNGINSAALKNRLESIYGNFSPFSSAKQKQIAGIIYGGKISGFEKKINDNLQIKMISDWELLLGVYNNNELVLVVEYYSPLIYNRIINIYENNIMNQ